MIFEAKQGHAQHQLAADAIAVLAVDAIEKAQSGHPGMPLGMAMIAAQLWRRHLRHDPAHPQWWNQDRFVLSNGHGSMLLYAALHLSGYDVSIDDLKAFRQLGSRTPGHPEFGHTPGVHATTGPLGQGLAACVGMALAQKHLASIYHRPQLPIMDHHTYAFVGDGCLMEGISHEACSLAGTQELSRLIVFWDDNGISIDGKVGPWFSEDVQARFKAYQWHVISLDGHDPDAIDDAIMAAKADKRPSLLACRTTIGYRSALANTAAVHGSPLGSEYIQAFKKAIGWTRPPFEIPDSIYRDWSARQSGKRSHDQWLVQWQQYVEQYPQEAQELARRFQGKRHDDFDQTMQHLFTHALHSGKAMATRKASQACIETMQPIMPEWLGGSADLTHSNLTAWKHAKALTPQYPQGQYLHYGVREFASFAMANGMAWHGGILPYVGTFLTFVDYARNAQRLAAMSNLPVIYILTHDSVALGEDGPTHQPIEHLAILRATPKLTVWRPADWPETVVAWQEACLQQGPTVLALSRQSLPHLGENRSMTAMIQGAYILKDTKNPDICLVASGSEVALACQAYHTLTSQGVRVSVISMPCLGRFIELDASSQQSILPSHVPRVLIEAAHPMAWGDFKRDQDMIIGITDYGFSAPGEQAMTQAGMCIERITHAVQRILQNTVDLP